MFWHDRLMKYSRLVRLDLAGYLAYLLVPSVRSDPLV